MRSTGYSVRDVTGGTVTNITKFDGFTASFNRLSGAGLSAALTAPPTLVPRAGVCTVVTSITTPTYSIAPLNAGPSVSVNGPNGTQVATLLQPGLYNATVPNTYMAQGRYAFTGTGGTDVGAFTGTLDVSPELAWTNTDAAKTITRSNDLTVQWTGGIPPNWLLSRG